MRIWRSSADPVGIRHHVDALVAEPAGTRGPQVREGDADGAHQLGPDRGGKITRLAGGRITEQDAGPAQPPAPRQVAQQGPAGNYDDDDGKR
jgi:hypothetical protein